MIEAHSQTADNICKKIQCMDWNFNDRVLGPFFIDGNLIAEKYENMLRDKIMAAIRIIVSSNFNDV